jgi:hypothetical protein
MCYRTGRFVRCSRSSFAFSLQCRIAQKSQLSHLIYPIVLRNNNFHLQHVFGAVTSSPKGAGSLPSPMLDTRSSFAGMAASPDPLIVETWSRTFRSDRASE